MKAEARRLEMLQSKEGRKKRIKSRKVGIHLIAMITFGLYED